jgi:hypothetical protein
VETQIWPAVYVYALAAIVKKELALDIALWLPSESRLTRACWKTRLCCSLIGMPFFRPAARHILP